MAREDRGMRLSTRGLSLSGEQVIGLKNAHGRDEIVILNDGAMESLVYDPTTDNGFSSSLSVSAFEQAVMDGNFLLGGEKIMEIAGGASLKVRYDNGLCLIGSKVGGKFILSEERDVARVTRNGIYKVATSIQYYKSGAGIAPLVPILEGGAVAIFEGVDSDHVVTVDDLLAHPDGIRGFVGGLLVTGTEGSYVLHTTDGEKNIESFGTIVREIDATQEIQLGTQIATNENEAVDHSAKFSPLHYSYIQPHRIDWKNAWAGVGNVGYIVDMGDYAQMLVPCGGNSGVLGEPLRVTTPAISDVIPFVVVGGTYKKVNADGTLENLGTTSQTGSDLIEHIYSHDMREYVAIDTANNGAEPFSINGYFFGYTDGHLVDANLQEL